MHLVLGAIDGTATGLQATDPRIVRGRPCPLPVSLVKRRLDVVPVLIHFNSILSKQTFPNETVPWARCLTRQEGRPLVCEWDMRVLTRSELRRGAEPRPTRPMVRSYRPGDYD